MLRRTLCSLLTLGAIVAAIGTLVFGETSDKTLEQAHALTEAAASGTKELFRYIHENRPSPPLIYSQWYVDRLANKQPKHAELEQARRDFGKKVLKALEDTAVENLALSESATRESAATMLLDLADWFDKQPGYGNALLFSRCQDMATVPIAHLIADLNYSDEKLAALASRLVSFPEDVKRNARVLNQEAPFALFTPGEGNSDNVIRPMERAWLKKITEVRKWQKEHGKPVGWVVGKQLREELPKGLAFFCDDKYSEAPRPFTTLKQWDKKYHRRLFLGLGGYNIRNVQSFLLFRKKVGHFPTKAPSWWKPGDGVFPTPVHAAFDVVWAPYRSEHGPTYAIAAEAYNAVQSNTFHDEDTRRMQQYKASQNANAKLHKPQAPQTP